MFVSHVWCMIALLLGPHTWSMDSYITDNINSFLTIEFTITIIIKLKIYHGLKVVKEITEMWQSPCVDATVITQLISTWVVTYEVTRVHGRIIGTWTFWWLFHICPTCIHDFSQCEVVPSNILHGSSKNELEWTQKHWTLI